MIKILYVDDEPVLLELARIFIEKSGDFSVDTAESAALALELMKTGEYDAVISDYQMAGMDGIELLKAIRASGDKIPFIIFTGKGREEVVIQAFENGADFYIQKGGEPNSQFVELVHKVRQSIALRQTEAALKDSEEKYRLLVEKANEAIFITQDHMVRFSNPRFSSILDIPPGELVGKSIDDLIHPDDREMVLGRYERRIAGKSAPEEYEFRVLDSSGNTHWVKIHATLIHWEEKPALLIILDEITERKAAEDELQESNRKLAELNEELRMHLKTIADRNDEIQGAYEQLKAAEEELRQNYDELGQKEILLRENEEKFRRIVETAEEGIWEMDNRETTTFVNKKMAEMLGYSTEEMVGGKISSFIHPGDQKDHLSEVEHRKGGATGLYVRRMIRKDGEIRWMKVKSTPILGKNGNFRGSFAMVSDITEQKHAEDALRESRQELMDIIDFLPDATFVIDNHGKVIAWNRAIEEMTGVMSEDIVGKGDYEYALPFYREKKPILIDMVLNSDLFGESHYPSVITDGNRLISEIEIPYLYDGKGAYLWFISTPLYDPDGKITGAIESIRDITAKKESEDALIKRNKELTSAYEKLAVMEEELRQGFDELEKSHRELRESEEKYRNLIENAPIGIFTSTSDGEFLTLNGTGAKILGFSSPEEVTGSPGSLKDILHSDPAGSDLLTDTLLEKGYLEDFNFEYLKKGETEKKHLKINACISQSNKDGSFIVLGFFDDVGGVKNIQETLENANHKLKLLYSITRHDILNSVMAAYCFIELLKNPEDPEYGQYIDTLHELLEKIQKQIEFTREYENLGSHVPVWQNLAEILAVVRSQSSLHFEITGCDIEILADPILRKVFDTLLDNTVRHGGESVSRVEVSCMRSENRGYSIVWKDDGAGIPDDDKELIFERGFGKNTGLGLFLAREILAISGVEIKECGLQGRGARFEMTVPEGKYRVISGC
jgi:PAS domain S-box-containing protein